jgi:hypothetical protein
MSALPNTLSTPPKKSPAKATRPAKLNQYGRDSGSPSERMRVSDYEREKGYSPFYHSFMSDIPRLTSGNSCTLLLMTIWSKSAGRGFKVGRGNKGVSGERHEWTVALSVADLAQICRCDERTIERELKAMGARGLAEVKTEGKGMISARLKYRDWESLPDYRSQVVEMPGTDEETAGPETVDESKPGNQRVTGKSAVRIAAGKLSRVYPVSTGVKGFRYRADGPVDLDVTCVIQAGELVVTSRLPEAWAQKLEILKTSSHVSNDLTSPPRHGRRGEGGRKAAPVDHPRAGELVKLFDPLLGQSGAVLLAMDSGSLRSACEAVADCDHDFLVKFSVNRASSPIRKPSYVAIICREALTSWKASKVLDGARVSKADIDAMADAEIADLQRKRREMAKRRS